MPPLPKLNKVNKGAERAAAVFFNGAQARTGVVVDHPAAQMAGIPVNTPRIIVVPIDDIVPNPNNHRRVFNQAVLGGEHIHSRHAVSAVGAPDGHAQQVYAGWR